MPNGSGPHGDTNVKGPDFPASLNPGMIIGYTGSVTDYPTVYFTAGHYTQKHRERWNIGWDSYEGWECKFFGNVPIPDPKNTPRNAKDPDSSSDAQGHALPVDGYVKKLEGLGKNRFKGGNTQNLNNWNLDKTRDTRPAADQILRLREFWIRGAGTPSRDRFPHPSRHEFIPVPFSEKKVRDELWNQVVLVRYQLISFGTEAKGKDFVPKKKR